MLSWAMMVSSFLSSSFMYLEYKYLSSQLSQIRVNLPSYLLLRFLRMCSLQAGQLQKPLHYIWGTIFSFFPSSRPHKLNRKGPASGLLSLQGLIEQSCWSHRWTQLAQWLMFEEIRATPFVWFSFISLLRKECTFLSLGSAGSLGHMLIKILL